MAISIFVSILVLCIVRFDTWLLINDYIHGYEICADCQTGFRLNLYLDVDASLVDFDI